MSTQHSMLINLYDSETGGTDMHAMVRITMFFYTVQQKPNNNVD